MPLPYSCHTEIPVATRSSDPENPSPSRSIRVRGAREHNLKSLSVDIPRDQLVVITGVSGSGTSSLAFDTIFAEGQRKYMDSLSAYARQFLDQMSKPDVESVEGLPPTIAIEQRWGGHTPRSTVATTTELYDHLRLLYARCGTPTCWHESTSGARCGRAMTATSPAAIVDALLSSSPSQRAILCAPVIRGKKGFHRETLEELQRAGFMRARVNGTLVDLREVLRRGGENPLELGRYEAHSIEAVVDRLELNPADRPRIVESVETALRVGNSTLVALVAPIGDDSRDWQSHTFSSRLACPDHPECALEELEPRLFSFNSPHGACAECNGLGEVSVFEEALVVPDPSLPVGRGAIMPFRHSGPRMNARYSRLLRKLCLALKVDPLTPYSALTPEARAVLLNGVPPAQAVRGSWEGVLPHLSRRYRETESDHVREWLRRWMHDAPCPKCQGRRLRESALAVQLTSGGQSRSIAAVTELSIEAAEQFLGALKLSVESTTIGAPILRGIHARLGFLRSVGLGYLTLDRRSATLSGGEAQRIRLATQVGSGLVGVAYVLDEPTIGLHHRDNERLIHTLRKLCDIGNSVLVVEHDEAMIRAADHVVDVGPGPGRLGGQLVAEGSVATLCACPSSLTGDYLSGRRRIAAPEQRRGLDPRRAIEIVGASEHNLQHLTVRVPLGGLVCVTGVSGSGKSTLVHDCLLRAARAEVHNSKETPARVQAVRGLKQVQRVVEVDQSPIGRTPRSNPATYTGIFDHIRSVFARLPEARLRGYEPGRFSFNVAGGRCEACTGQGVRRIEMHFLPDVFVTCEECSGSRYNRQTLELRLKGKTIADVLAMTLDEAQDFFDPYPRIARLVHCLREVGLGYMHLGQASTTMSGGEAQRVKLAAELGNDSAEHTLYVLDEPTTGLHFADVDRLLHVLQRLADAGHSLLVIEHNIDVIRCADWVIDLGPEGGVGGGQLVAEGTPETVAATEGSFTALALREVGVVAQRAPIAEPALTATNADPTAGEKRSRRPAPRGSQTQSASRRTARGRGG